MSWTYNRVDVARQEVELARREIVTLRKRLNAACDERDMDEVKRLIGQIEAAKDRCEASRELLWEAE
ncbi:MAG: hypothetical protein U0835_00310 [Isosphaeraceae bacterium]